MTIKERLCEASSNCSAIELTLEQTKKDLLAAQKYRDSLTQAVEKEFMDIINAELKTLPFDIPEVWKANMRFVHSRVDLHGGGIVLSVEVPEAGIVADGVRYSWKEVELRLADADARMRIATAGQARVKRIEFHSSAEVNPCPHCKNQPGLYHTIGEIGGYFVECCGVKTQGYKLPGGAIMVWNDKKARKETQK